MPLVSMIDELKRAQTGRYAVPLLCFCEMTAVEGIVAALEERHAPGILGIYTYLVDDSRIEAYVGFIRKLCEKATVPISLMLDHGTSFEQCVRALAYGFTDVMLDGSKLPLEENISATRLVVRAAHAAGAGVEAEVGHVGSGQEYGDFGSRRQGFTDPADAERFVAETGVDCLAVAFGSAHGVYQGTPQLDLELVEEIRRRVKTPLALHGGTGLSEAQFRGAIDAGVAKINIGTDLVLASTREMVAEAGAEDTTYHKILQRARDAHRERSGYYLDVFRASGKAQGRR
jgi:fructose-bisphosphate aldolase class II